MEQVISYAETALLVAWWLLSWQMHWSYEYWSTMHMSHLHETHYWFPRCSQEFPKIYPHINCGLKYQKVQYTNKVKHSKPFNILELHSHTSRRKSKLAISIYFICFQERAVRDAFMDHGLKVCLSSSERCSFHVVLLSDCISVILQQSK